MTNTCEVMPVRVASPPTNPVSHSSTHSEAVSISSSPGYLPVNTTAHAGHTPPPPRMMPNNASANGDDQSQSQTPTPTRPIHIIPPKRARERERLGPLGFEVPNNRAREDVWRPYSFRAHHRDDKVMHYHALGTRGWDGFQHKRVQAGEAGIGRVDTSWTGGVIREFGAKKNRKSDDNSDDKERETEGNPVQGDGVREEDKAEGA